jgi:hypothetical protein
LELKWGKKTGGKKHSNRKRRNFLTTLRATGRKMYIYIRINHRERMRRIIKRQNRRRIGSWKMRMWWRIMPQRRLKDILNLSLTLSNFKIHREERKRRR